jgi:hypothetical protein
MTRLIRVLKAAAALVLTGGLALGVALNQGAQTVEPRYTCAEWAEVARRYSDPQQQETFFVALPVGATVPAAYGDRVLGNCSAGECTIKPAACDGGRVWYGTGPLGEHTRIEGTMTGVPNPFAEQYAGWTWQAVGYWGGVAVWTYRLGAPLGGTVVARATAPTYIAEGLRQWVGSVANGRWLGSWGQAVQTCLTLTTAANCRTMLAPLADCWRFADGRLCRYGRLYGPGEGGAQACTPDAGARPMPCEVSRGAGSELVDAAREWTAADLAAGE